MRLVSVLCVTALSLAGCAGPGTEGGDDRGDGRQTGVNLSPRDFDAHFASFWDEAADAGTVVAWAGALDELGDPDAAPAVTARLNREHGFETALRTSPFRAASGVFAVPFGEDARAGFVDDLVAFVNEHDVAFLGLGSEIDLIAEKNPEGYGRFVAWWPEVYRAVKEASPATLVYVSFQYEHMSGLQGGLYAKTNAEPTHWQRLDDFPDRDVTGFTTYPGLVFPDPDDLPEDYYTNMTRHAGGPIAITEVGHPAQSIISGFEASMEEQRRFVVWFTENAPAARLTLWLHLYDQPGDPPFDTMGLRHDDGTARPALAAWRDHVRTD